MKRFKKRQIVVLTLLLLISWAAGTLYYQSNSIQWIEGQELIGSYPSPNGGYLLNVYLDGGGATVGFSTLGRVIDQTTGKGKNIYFQYQCWKAEVEWLDETLVSINGIVLNVERDIYDYSDYISTGRPYGLIQR